VEGHIDREAVRAGRALSAGAVEGAVRVRNLDQRAVAASGRRGDPEPRLREREDFARWSREIGADDLVEVGERPGDGRRRRLGAVEEPNDPAGNAGRRGRDDRAQHECGRDRHDRPSLRAGLRPDLAPARVVCPVRKQGEALAKLPVHSVDHLAAAPFGFMAVRSSAWAWASDAAIVPSLTSQAAAISAYEKSPK